MQLVDGSIFLSNDEKNKKIVAIYNVLGLYRAISKFFACGINVFF